MGARSLLTCINVSTDKYRSRLSRDLRKRDLAQRSFGCRQLLQRLRTTQRERTGRASTRVILACTVSSECGEVGQRLSTL